MILSGFLLIRAGAGFGIFEQRERSDAEAREGINPSTEYDPFSSVCFGGFWSSADEQNRCGAYLISLATRMPSAASTGVLRRCPVFQANCASMAAMTSAR